MDKTVIILIGAGVCCVVIGFALFVKLLTTKSNDDDETTGNRKLLDVEDGSYIIYTDKSTRPQDLLGADGYKSTEEIVKEFKEKLAAYVPDGFDWESHIGFFQCATFA